MSILNARFDAPADAPTGQRERLLSSALHQLGPRLQVTLSPLEAQTKAIADRGEPLPNPISGVALIDIGALCTCIDQKAAEAAGLAVVDSGFMTSATHENELVPVYAARLDIAGIPENVEAKRAYGAMLEPQGLIALVGRDLLASCILVYNGPDGSFSLSL